MTLTGKKADGIGGEDHDDDAALPPLDPAALAAEARRTRPTEPPAWVRALKPRNPPTDGTNGMHRVIGALDIPGTDEEIAAILEELS